MLGWAVTAARNISQRYGEQGGCCEPNCSGPCQLDVSIPGKSECTIISSKSECTFPHPRRRPATAPRSTPLTARQPATLPTAREPAAPADRTRTDRLPPAVSVTASDRLPPAAREVGTPSTCGSTCGSKRQVALPAGLTAAGPVKVCDSEAQSRPAKFGPDRAGPSRPRQPQTSAVCADSSH